MDQAYPQSDLLAAINTLWLSKIKVALDFKREEFQDYADEAWAYFDGAQQLRWGDVQAGLPGIDDTQVLSGVVGPRIEFTAKVNKVAELVQMLLPRLYFRNPKRTVSPRQTPLELQDFLTLPETAGAAPFLEQKRHRDTIAARLREWYLNYTPEEFNLLDEAKLAVQEAIIKGLGVCWLELTTIASGAQMPRWTFGSCDDLLLDPDARRFRDCQWIARRRRQPCWEVERKFRLAEGSVKGSTESKDREAEIESGVSDVDQYDRRTGSSNDLVTYWEIWSRMGIGHRLKGFKPDYGEDLSVFGDYVYLAVCQSCDHPLNLPSELLADAGGLPAMVALAQWETPSYLDATWPWPAAILALRPRPGKLYPMSVVKPARSELRSLDWLYTFLMNHVRTASRQMFALDPDCPQGLEEQIVNGPHNSVFRLTNANGKKPADMISEIQHQPLNTDVWAIIQAVEQNYQMRTGVTEMSLGMTPDTQSRSATDSAQREQASQGRIQDMVTAVDEWASLQARMEMIAAALHVRPETIAQLVGEPPPSMQMAVDPMGQPMLDPMGQPIEIPQVGPVTQLWMDLIQSDDVARIVGEFDYSIEEGTGQRLDHSARLSNLNEALKVMMPILVQQMAATGNPQPVNALLSGWAREMMLPAQDFMLTPPPPPPPPGAVGPNGEPMPGGPPPEGGPPQEMAA